jgi:hypothetical protein
MRGEYDLERQRIANQGAVQTAQARSAAKVRTALDALNQAKTATQAVTAAHRIINDSEMPEEIRQMAIKVYEANMAGYQREQQRGAMPQFQGSPFNIPPVQTPQYGSQQGAAPGGGATHRFNPQTGKVEPIR